MVGIILGAAGLGLGIFALIKKQPKGMAITGTALAGVALVASLITTIAAGALTSAVVDTVEKKTAVTAETPSDDQQSANKSDDQAESTETEAAPAEGTRESPYPLGSTISSADWDVVINSVNLAANEEVAAANQFNQAPAEGSQYALVNATISYKGSGSSFPAFVGIDYVTAGGEVIRTWDSIAVAPDPTFGAAELYAGASATGNIAFAIPTSADGVLRVKPGILADEVFVNVQ